MGATATRRMTAERAAELSRERKLTADEFRALTTEGDRTQLVEGRIVVNDPKLIHGELQLRLAIALRSWAAAGEGRGQAFLPTDVQLDEHNVYGPDLLWFAADRVPTELDAYPERIPDLCVEVRSESTWRYDVGAKKRNYEAAGLPELWLVDHASDSVLVYRRPKPRSRLFDIELELAAGEELTSPQLPGFSLAIDELFAR